MAVIHFLDATPFSYFAEVLHIRSLPHSTDLSPAEYLAFAKQDFEVGDDRGLVNALGNAKRSLHLMVDNLLHSYGLLARNGKQNFEAKLRLLDACGLISLNVFRKLNVERNTMEHDYRVPDRDTVSDAIDVCQLLLLASDRLCQDLPYEGLVGVRESGKHALFRLDPLAGEISLTEILQPKTQFSEESNVHYVVPVFQEGMTRKPKPEMLAPQPFMTMQLTHGAMVRWKDYLTVIVEIKSETSSRMRTWNAECRMQVWHWVEMPISYAEAIEKWLLGRREEPQSITS